MVDVPEFATHYHLADRPPFLNLSDLDDAQLVTVLHDLGLTAGAARSERRFGPRYMQLRRETERLMRERFIRRGGRPTRLSPNYFVLGESAWFRGLYRDAAEVRVELSDLPSEQVSFTLPDSITSMGLASRFGVDVPVQPHHGMVFRLDELADAVSRYGRPNSPKPASYDRHQFDAFEHYVEIQIWCDEAISPQVGRNP